LFDGQFDGQKGNRTAPVNASGLVYSNERGYLITGLWLEDGCEQKWWVELDPVESFADELQKVAT
jgi:hypothetical protein